MEFHHPIMSKLRGLGDQTYRQILDTIVREYIEIEAILVSNMNIIYGIIWGQCTPGLQSHLKVNEDFPYKSNKSTCYGSCRRPIISLR